MQYLGATPGFVEKVVADYIRGANLEKCIPGATVVDLEWFAAEAIEAAAIHRKPAQLLAELDAHELGDLAALHVAETLQQTAYRAGGAQRDTLLAAAERAFAAAADSPIRTFGVWYSDVFFDLAQLRRRRGDGSAVELVERALRFDVEWEEATNVCSRIGDLGETLMMVGRPDDGLRTFAALLRTGPPSPWQWTALRHGMEWLDTPGLHEQVCRAGLARLRDSNDRDAAEVRSQLEEALSRPPEPRDRVHRPSAEAVHDLTEALAEPLPSVASYDKWDPAAVARRIVPHFDAVRAKRAPVAEDLRPRQAVLLAATAQRHVESHAQRLRTSTGAKVGRNDPCPCGSGKKYKRCCGVC